MLILYATWFLLGMAAAFVIGMHMKLRYDEQKENAEFEARYLDHVRG